MVNGQKYKMEAPIASEDEGRKMEVCVLVEFARPFVGSAPSVGWSWAFTLGLRVPGRKWGLYVGALFPGSPQRCLRLMIPRCTQLRDFSILTV